MSLRIGDKVIIKNKTKTLSINGTVVDLKWNLILIVFESGETEWVDSRLVYPLSAHS